jgi:uncharacterized membrane protein YkvA (DUF1232 family)
VAHKAPLTFFEAKEAAPAYLMHNRKLSLLLEQATRKAAQSYEFLLLEWESLQMLFRLVRSWLVREYSPPINTLLMAIAALVYFLEPFDLIPDGVPVFGLLDDAAVITAVVKANLSEISRFRNWESTQSLTPPHPS